MSAALDSIDLGKPADVILMHRAVVGGWPLSPAVIAKVLGQIGTALQVADEHAKTNPRKGANQRARLIKIRDVLRAREGPARQVVST